MADKTIGSDNYNDAQMQHQHQLTQAQLEAIESDIKATQPLTSPLLPISVLVQQYTNDNADNDETTGGGSGSQAGFLQAATFLSKKYTSYRTIRGDGNCYYRSFLYSLCERLLRSLLLGVLDNNDNNNDNDNNTNDIDSKKKEFNRIKQHISKSLKWVCQYGYDEYTIDMFYEELVELFDFIEQAQEVQVSKKKKDASVTVAVLEDALKELHTKLNEENACSDYCTWFMRVMTAAQMKSNPEKYIPFVMADNDYYADIPSFCSREVEPMGKECGMVQVSALAECMGVKVIIEYMDGRELKLNNKLNNNDDEVVVHHVFGEGNNEDGEDDERKTSITLLYRPGHYDILY